jgi:hypothetical protein
MIRLNVREQELFDLIMALYLDAAVEHSQRHPDVAGRREALLEKLHDAFDNKILLAELEDRQPAPVRGGPRTPAR